MKSSFWVLCGVTLLCFGSARCSGHFLDDDENFLDKTRYEERTWKEEDTEWELYKARNSWNDLTNELNKLSRLKMSGSEGSCVDDTCYNGECDEEKGKCVCTKEFSGDKCEIFSNAECQNKKAICASTGGTCKSVNSKENVQCECPSDKRLTEKEGCKNLCADVVCYNGECNADTGKCDCTSGFSGNMCEKFSEEECQNKIAICASTGGTCKSVDSKENVQCECPSDKRLTEKEGCKNLCEEVTCYNGACNADTGKCDCTFGFSGNMCEKFSNEECQIKIAICASTGGTCKSVDSKENVQCECPSDKILTKDEGCKTPAENVCNDVTCFNGGSCKDNNGEASCDCIKDFTGNRCEIFPDGECKKVNETCAETKGQCISVDNDNVKCNCPAGTTFVATDGCKDLCEGVTCYNGGTCESKNGKAICKCTGEFTGGKCEIFSKEECKKEISECAETNGTCKSVDEKKIECKCPSGYTFVENDGCQKTSDVNCKEVCGESEDVTCGGNKMDKTKIRCTCKEETEDFDKENKECKTDYCKKICGKVQCKGNKFEEDEIECICPKEEQDFDKDEKKCKINYCTKVCGKDERVKCEGEPYETKTPKCSCHDDEHIFVKRNECKQKCDDDCENEGKCEGKEGEKLCKCKDGTTGDLCGTITACQKDGKYEKCKGEKGTCVFKNGKSDCECPEEKKLFQILKYCEVNCTAKDVDCGENRECNSTYKFCQCKKGYEGDDCDVVTGCKTLKATCDKIGKACIFDKDAPIQATCECAAGYKYNPKVENCSPICKDKKCEGNRQCNTENFCMCIDGYTGDDCTTVKGCKELKAQCDKLEVECIFDENASNKATCNCTEGFKYDRQKNECKHNFCYPKNNCKGKGNCTFDPSTRTGFCQCPESQYYNYKTEKCEDFQDKCLLRKNPCSENQECKQGECKCKYTKKDDEDCKAKLCEKTSCFTGGKCKDDDGSCYCEETKFYHDRKCKDAKCNLKEFKTNCTCPGNRKKGEGKTDCLPTKEEEMCKNNTECGYGICILQNKKDTCKCFEFATNINGRKCFLKTTYCAGGQLEKGLMKCNCTGQYIQADDGITCRLKTCADDGVKEECLSKGGECKMDWKGIGYYCECPTGYVVGANNKCTDPCSIEDNIITCAEKGQFCYNSYSSSNKVTTSCDCPPTIKKVNNMCSDKAEFAYLIKNIPVLKKRYELKSGINKVLLNAHLIASMQQTFRAEFYDYGYLYDYKVEGDVVYCSVWIHFKSDPGQSELNRLKIASKTFSDVCTDCDKDAVVWPPNLLLSEKGLKEVVSDKLEFCSNEVKDRLCGKGASCNKKTNKCFCDEGYKLIEYSIREIGPYKVQRCEDIDECAEGTHTCSKNTNCRNTFGNYACVCQEGFKKKVKPSDPETDKTECVDMCTDSPCKQGTCKLKEKTFDCECKPGYGGSLCDRADANYKSAKHSTVVVGAVLGTILAVAAIAAIYYIIKRKKRSGSEDFRPAARMDHAEMTERRHMRGVTNKAYE